MKLVYAEHRNISIIHIFILHFSDLSGVFTVPTHGLYQFSVSVLSFHGDNFDVRLMRNDELLCRGYAEGRHCEHLIPFILFEMRKWSECQFSVLKWTMPFIIDRAIKVCDTVHRKSNQLISLYFVFFCHFPSLEYIRVKSVRCYTNLTVLSKP